MIAIRDFATDIVEELVLKGNNGLRVAAKTHPKHAHDAAMKAAVVSLTKSMGMHCAPDGILINGVAPAAIATEKARAAGFLPELEAQTPIGRAAEPDDTADVIAFLLSDKNRYMVGETVGISGGYFIPRSGGYSAQSFRPKS